MFDLHHKYAFFKDLRLYVIDKSIKEINEHTDIEVSYKQKRDYIKRGRKIIGIDFKIGLNKKRLKEKKAKAKAQDKVQSEREKQATLNHINKLKNIIKHKEIEEKKKKGQVSY